MRVEATTERDGYLQQTATFTGYEGEPVPAILLTPLGDGRYPAVLAPHQHNSEWHLGKSEVAGLVGNPLQAFGPALARRGVAVLAPDAVGFEDRRASGPGVEPRERDGAEHFNEMAYRLVEGRLLATTVLGDAMAGISALRSLSTIDRERVGVVGHSYGGNVALLLAALDRRVGFACASGAACTYRHRMRSRTGIELAHLVPGILRLADVDAFAALVAPHPLLLVSAPEDPYSADADRIEGAAKPAYAVWGAERALQHARFPGGHALTEERHRCVVEWVARVAASARHG